jgi:hypothetical protein
MLVPVNVLIAAAYAYRSSTVMVLASRVLVSMLTDVI